MYPIIRLAIKLAHARFQTPLTIHDTHVSKVTCMPWDLDIFMELNNGSTLSLLDLGRIPFAIRAGLTDAMTKNGWGMTMAGVSVRYRRRVRMFNRVTIRTKAVGRDDKFLYLVQSMWYKGEATSSALYRSALTDKNGIVSPDKVLRAMGEEGWNPEMPRWVKSWISAEADRAWPPEE